MALDKQRQIPLFSPPSEADSYCKRMELKTVVKMSRSDRGARAFVWSVWLVMMLVAIFCLAKFGRNVPLNEDWLLVPPLTGNEPDLLRWLWAQNSEHRIPLPRLMLLLLLKGTQGDFRTGMFINLLLFGGLAFFMIRCARHLRGGRTNFADAFFPIALLHLGNWPNFAWSWMLTFDFPTVLLCGILLILLSRQTLTRSGAAVIAGLSLASLPLCGANGLLMVPILALWFAYCGLRQLRQPEKPKAERQWVSGFLIGSAAVALVFTCLYFVGYERPTWNPPNAGFGASLVATVQFLALSIGPAARSSWILSSVATIGAFLSSAIVALLEILRHKDEERQRALGLLLFLGNVAVLALAVGWGRAAAIPFYGDAWPIRYVVLALPTIFAAFFICELYGPPKLRSIIQNGLFLGMLFLIPFNTIQGLSWAKWFIEKDKLLNKDLIAGVPPADLAERHKDLLSQITEPSQIANMIDMLREAGIGPLQPQPLVTMKIGYAIPQADEVFLVWGIDGGQIRAKALPPGTVVKDAVMHTPMICERDAFVTQMQVPAGNTIYYGFLITKKTNGAPARVWEADGGQNYRMTVAEDGPVEIGTRLALTQKKTAGNLVAVSLATQEFRYSMPEAGEVFLLWGINGWRSMSWEISPRGTFIKDKVMHTRMIHEDDAFVVQVQTPVGVTLEYGFLITKNRNGADINAVWDGKQDYRIAVSGDGFREVKATFPLERDAPPVREAKAALFLARDRAPVSALGVSLVTQDIHYHLPQAGHVSLVWGIDGWHAMREEVWPPKTILKGGVMHTPMIQEGNAFVARVKVTSGTTLDYGFLIKEKKGVFDIVTPIWDGGEVSHKPVTEDGFIEVKSTLTFPNEIQSILDLKLYFLAGGGILLGAWFLGFSLLRFLKL